MTSIEPLPLDAAQKAARRAYKKSLPKAVRKAAKATGWRSSQGYIFREAAGWFVFATLGVNLRRRETLIRLAVKPMQIDPIFWSIVGLEDNVTQPLSFRLFGAWTCGQPDLYKAEVAESDDLTQIDDIAASLLSAAEAHLPKIQKLTPEDFLTLCRRTPRPENFLAAEVTTLIVLEDTDQARTLCQQAISAGHTGGFLSSRRSFPKMAIDWLSTD